MEQVHEWDVNTEEELSPWQKDDGDVTQVKQPDPWKKYGCYVIQLESAFIGWNEVLKATADERLNIRNRIRIEVINAVLSRAYYPIKTPCLGLHLVFTVSREHHVMDSDNICAKYYIDSLCDVGLIPDDSPDCINQVTLSSCQSGGATQSNIIIYDPFRAMEMIDPEFRHETIQFYDGMWANLPNRRFIPLPQQHPHTEPDSSTFPAGVALFYSQNFGRVTPFIEEELDRLSRAYSSSLLLYALQEATRKEVRRLNYVEAILRNQVKGMA